MTLYDQVGGADAVRTAVAVFYKRVVEDPSLSAWFDGVDLTRLKAHQRAFLGAALGGPDVFTGRDGLAAHAGLGITDEAFDTVVDHLATALADLDVAPSAIELVASRLEDLRPQIVTA